MTSDQKKKMAPNVQLSTTYSTQYDKYTTFFMYNEKHIFFNRQQRHVLRNPKKRGHTLRLHAIDTVNAKATTN